MHLRRSKVAAHRRRLGCVFQDFRLLTNKTVEQNVGFALEVIGRSRASIKQVVPEVLEMVGLEGKANRLPHELSGGEQQRVAIARAFANRPLLLLADEPTGNLDPDTSADIMLLLERINRTGTTVLMATHDNTIVDSMRRRVIELQLGKVVRDEARGVYGVGGSNVRPPAESATQRSTSRRHTRGTHARRICRHRGPERISSKHHHDHRDDPDHRDLARAARRRADHRQDDRPDARHLRRQGRGHHLPDAGPVGAGPGLPGSRRARTSTTQLQANTDVESIDFESQAAAYERYKQQFAGQPELLEIGTPEALSASFHVKLYDPQRYRVIAEQFDGKPGVQSVADQSAFLDRLFSLLNGIRNATIIVALIQALAALLLISNMVQVAAYTRRTETSIMRLVGASRWRTQLPFMLEAVIAGVVGAVLAIGGLVAAKFLFVDQALGPVIRSGILPEIDGATLVWVSPILLAIGAGLAAVSAYVTLRLYVRL